MKEIWKKIKDTNNYEVSNLGRFKANGLISSAEGYYSHINVSWITNSGEKKQKGLHRLVFEYFKHPIPAKMVINHIDGVKNNNRIDNLECISQSQNIKHAYDNGLYTTREYKKRGGKREGSGRPKNENKAYLIQCHPSKIQEVRDFAKKISENV